VTLKEQLNADLREAMRGNQEPRRTTLRLLITSIRNAEIPPEGQDADAGADGARRLDLDDDAVLNVIRKEIKQRRDAIDLYKKANRLDLAAKEEAEADVLGVYLPAQMSKDEIATVARAIMERVGASGPADKGKVMPAVMAELRGKAEGRDINEVVSQLLSGA
jgi:uncharacterized protein